MAEPSVACQARLAEAGSSYLTSLDHMRGKSCAISMLHEHDMILQDAILPRGESLIGRRIIAHAGFELGELLITPAAAAFVPQHEVLTAIARHSRGDWGELSPEDRQANKRALREGGQLVSVYHTVQGVKFYVVTDAGRDCTTVLLPEDY